MNLLRTRAAAAVLAAGVGSSLAVALPPAPETAGPKPDGRVLLPIQQIVTPAGRQILLPKLRPQDIALSPDGSFFAASGRSAELILIDPVQASILGTVPMPSGKTTAPPQAADHILVADPKAQISFHGLVFSPTGDRAYLSNVNGDIKVFAADPQKKLKPLFSIALPPVSGLARREEIPAGLAVSADGATLYAALNLGNRLAVISAASGTLVRAIDVGVAPYDVAVAGDKAYVSCWGGRRPGRADAVGPAGQGAVVRTDPVTGVAAEGSVSVVDLKAGRVTSEILTGQHASALALSPDGKRLAVANANSDTVSVLDTSRDEVIEQIRLDWQPLGYFGAAPNALCFSANGRTLYVANGTQNAVAVVAFRPPASKLAGLIPVGWYPGALALDAARRQLAVANLKGIGSGGRALLDGKKSFNSHDHTGSVTLLPIPGERDLKRHTEQVLANCRREVLEAATLPPRPGRPPRPVPERAGEPSVFQHVIYIVKENRTYDQVLGDMKEGNGDPSLCVFGEQVTPNQHKLAREFVLLDNTYCCGVLSADGHQWCMTGYVTDYLEKSFAGFPRSYPDGCGDGGFDALAYSPAGFIWDAALAKGRTVRTYGEFCLGNAAFWTDPARKGKPGWLDMVADWEKGGGAVGLRCRAGLPAMRDRVCTNTAGWETSVPDVLRADRFMAELRGWARAGGGLPNLSILTLPMDHTVGTGRGTPTPAATVADNDLAVGRIVEAVSKSPFWSNTVLFIIEDDPQNGWDHVSAYRTTAYVASPYTRRGAVVSEHYSQNSLLRSIELILGLPPMNQLDAIATPMTACFADTPDFTPFASESNRVPLTQMNGLLSDRDDPILRRDQIVSSRLPLDRVDACPEDVFNRILWRAMKGPRTPYPEWATLPEDMREDD